MATWKAIRSSSQDRSQDKQLDIEQAFKVEWLHSRIFGEGEATIVWCLLPPLYFFNFSALLHCTRIQMTFIPGIPKEESRDCLGLDSHNFGRSQLPAQTLDWNEV